MALTGEHLRDKLSAAKVFGELDSAYSVRAMVAPYAMPPSYFRPISDCPFSGVFTLSFVGRLSDAQRKTALAAALGRSRQRATELAEAAGTSLGQPRNVSCEIGVLSIIEQSIILGQSNAITQFPRMDESETSAPTPNLPEFTVRVNGDFTLLPKSP